MPIIICDIFETERSIKQLIKYGLVSQYKKVKEQLIEQGTNNSNKLKLRQPKNLGIRYFRINQQYRALARYIDDRLEVFDIDDHS